MHTDELTASSLYLDLMKRCLTRTGFGDVRAAPEPRAPWKAFLYRQVAKRTNRAIDLQRVPPDDAASASGREWPPDAETMIGLQRLDNIQDCVTDVIRNEVPGDLIETGVWRGGATIFMRAILAAYGATERRVWVADSFAGLPKPSGKYDVDEGDLHWTFSDLAVSEEQVRENFARYGLLDDQVRFLKGFFHETLPDAPIDRLAVARLDGDMYESTIVALEALYPKLSVGGYLIVDDFALKGAKRAVEDFRRERGIREPIVKIDWTGVYWQRTE